MKADITFADLVAAAREGERVPSGERMRVVARAYARLGLRVLPLWHVLDDGSCACLKRDHVPGGKDAGRAGKHPRSAGGVSNASRDPQTIDSWWQTWPNAGIGIATGHGLDVIDVDSRSGLRDVADLMAAERLPAAVAWARSGRSGGEGFHVVVPSQGKAGNAQALLPGVDYRGEGGYFVVAPTRHRSLQAYEWLTTSPLPEGDRLRGVAISVTLPWERPRAAGHPVTPREVAWIDKRLAAQAAKVRHARPTQRNPAVYSAGVSMGAHVQQGWIPRGRVEEAILSAYRDAGGEDPDILRTLARGLAASAHKDVQPLDGAGTEDVDAVLRSIRAWAGTAESRKALGWRHRVVLEWFLGQAKAGQSLVVRGAQRDIEIGANSSKGTVDRALQALLGLGVLTIFKKGSRGGREAALYRLTVPTSASHGGAQISAKPPVPHGDVPHVKKESAVMPGSTLQVLGHSVWNASGRGKGHGLTHVDRALLGALPAEGTPVQIAAWARDAEVSPSSAYRAADPQVRGSLAGLGIIQRRNGRVVATAVGADIARAVRGDAPLTVLDALAEYLGVDGRAEQRVRRVHAERDAHQRGLLPRVVERALRGREGQRRDARSVGDLLEPAARHAFARLLTMLDSAPEGSALRGPLARVVTCATDLGRGRKPPAEDDLRAAGVPDDALGRFLSPSWGDCVRVRDMAAVAAGVGLAANPPTDLVDAATGARLSASEADAVTASGGEVLRARAPVTAADWATEHVAARFAIDPLPSIREVMSEVRRAGQGRPIKVHAIAPSHGYVSVSPVRRPAVLLWQSAQDRVA